MSNMCWQNVQHVLADCPTCAGRLSNMCWQIVQHVLADCPTCAGRLSNMCWQNVQHVLAECPTYTGRLSNMCWQIVQHIQTTTNYLGLHLFQLRMILMELPTTSSMKYYPQVLALYQFWMRATAN
ncbi:hypothetical protein BsWGS_19273 [Bradybaena similaris]